MSFKKILIANRGEIACRVIRTARALGYRSVAVYSDADTQSPHVGLADEAVYIGPSVAAQSYLNISAVLQAAKDSGADAVHPGYGFLSERADFAQACTDAGMVFIGPPASAIKAMGDKAGAKRRMLAAGVPCAPGYLDADQSDARLTQEAAKLGVPLLVKAVSGGGGRGMRLVRTLDELPQALTGARREALSAFGDDTLMLERLIEGGRHIEIQIFADAHGNAVHLGERDCTAQRRRQKVIEEAPSPVVSAAMRARMGADAVAAALAVSYCGAGTVEFIVDAQMNHYFLEMNTRLQVEHPVTECITGLDLVEWQLRVASGERLPLAQEEVTFSGHAIELRLYAEDPYASFAPQTGKILHWRPVDALRGRDKSANADGYVRIDAGIDEGGTVSPFYDPMVAKVIAKGRDREDAIRRLMAALEDAPLLGFRNNGRFLRDLLDHPVFRSAQMHTSLLDQWAEQDAPLLRRPAPTAQCWAVAAAAFAIRHGHGARPSSLAGFDMVLTCSEHGSTAHTLRIALRGSGVSVTSHGTDTQVDCVSLQNHLLSYQLGAVKKSCVAVFDGDTLHVVQDAAVFVFKEKSAFPEPDTTVDARRARAPVAGTVAAVSVAVGDEVAAGQALVCVEAMKMEMWQHAKAPGRVTAVHVKAKDSVEAGTVLIDIELQETSA